ncbi:MAG: N-acetyltransferase, partial [Roseburia sp.]|nr:N-acetyltransferase [Roseburia sp.]
MSEIRIRKERENEKRETEYVTLRAFWNLHGPGCEEHLFVHLMRESDCYEKELSRVAELDGKVVGVILYAKAKVVDGDKTHEVLTFGPLAVEPTCQSMGIGEKLLKETISLAKEAGYPG